MAPRFVDGSAPQTGRVSGWRGRDIQKGLDLCRDHTHTQLLSRGHGRGVVVSACRHGQCRRGGKGVASVDEAVDEGEWPPPWNLCCWTDGGVVAVD